MTTNTIRGAIAAFGVALAAGAGASAQTIPYAAAGTYNATSYTFTATTTGDVIAYFTGSGGSIDKDVGLLVNGVATSAGYGLDSYKPTIVGTSFDFGAATAGDTLTFVLDNLSSGSQAYSDAAMNGAYDNAVDPIGHNHVYSTTYSADSGTFAGVPSGVYVAFEDLPIPGADFNYSDETFVVTNVTAAAVSAAPEPSTWALLLAGVAVLGMALRRRPRLAIA